MLAYHSTGRKFLYLGLLIFCLGFYSCISIQPIQIKGVQNFKTRNVLTNPEMTFDLELRNPNKFGLTLKSMSINIDMGDSAMAGIKIPLKSRINPNASVQIPVSFKPSISGLTQMALGGFNSIFSGSANQNISIGGEIIIRKFIFTHKIKFREKIKL